MKNFIYKTKHWIKRYGPWEILWTLGAVGWWYLGLAITGNEIAASFFGAWWENVWYYGYNIYQEVTAQKKLWYKWFKVIGNLCKEMFMEFGLSELLDSFLIRPWCMYLAGQRFSNYGLGLLVWKILADVIFYLPTSYFYQKRLKRDIDMLLDKIENTLK